jgi:spore maturation protein SpmA/spore maturation protein SpmB
MALSRFWLSIIIISIIFVLIKLFGGYYYNIDYLVNGKKDESILIRESFLNSLPKNIQDSLNANENKEYTVDETTYILNNNVVKITKGKQNADGILPTCKNSIFDIVLPLVAYLAFFCGILQLLIDSGAAEKLARLFSPVFLKIFPEVPANHPAISYMTLNFAANFLGLDSAATPFGLKAMESLQEINPDKEKASNSQIMFMCLHAAGLTLIPTSIIGYRAAQNATNPADVMLPCIITSFVGTIAALVIVGIRQKISFKSATLLLGIGFIMAIITALLFYIGGLDIVEKNHFTANISNAILLIIILGVLVFAFTKEKVFAANGADIFSSFVNGASQGLKTGVTIFPYILGMLVAISLFRNSGVFEIIANWISQFFGTMGVEKKVTDALPVAMLRPFSSGGARGFMIDAMHTYGPDSYTGRLVCVLQCSAETTFYVIAMYFGSVKIKNTRYTLSTMLLVDLICVIAAILICSLFF